MNTLELCQPSFTHQRLVFVLNRTIWIIQQLGLRFASLASLSEGHSKWVNWISSHSFLWHKDGQNTFTFISMWSLQLIRRYHERRDTGLKYTDHDYHVQGTNWTVICAWWHVVLRSSWGSTSRGRNTRARAGVRVRASSPAQSATSAPLIRMVWTCTSMVRVTRPCWGGGDTPDHTTDEDQDTSDHDEEGKPY